MNEEENVQLVEESLMSIFLSRFLYPFLYQPIKNLDNFLSENRHLLTQIGVFGAVSIYLRTVDNELEQTAKLFGEFALVAGFGIVIILSLVLMAKLAREIRLARHILAYQNWGLLAFSAFFLPLILVISGVVSQFRQIWAGYYYVAIYSTSLISVSASAVVIRNFSSVVSDLLPLDKLVVSTLTLGLVGITSFYVVATSSILFIKDSTIFISGNATIAQWMKLFVFIAAGIIGMGAGFAAVVNTCSLLLRKLWVVMTSIWK